jgi:hypothetical protein
MPVVKLPLNFSKLTDAWKEVSAITGEAAGVVLAGDKYLVGLAQQEFFAGGTLPAVWTRPVAELGEISTVPGELLVVLILAHEEEGALAGLARSVPAGGVVLAVDEGEAATDRIGSPMEGCTRLSFTDSAGGWRRLFDACVERAGDHAVALGRRYPVLRAAAARRVVYRTAVQNALVGLVFFVPGADMPVMTLNQIKMVMSIAAVYGEAIGKERAMEVAGVVGKASTGYTGTLAVGFAAIGYFHKGAPASTSRVLALADSLRR